MKYTGIFHVNTASNTVKDDKQFYLEYVSAKFDNKVAVKSGIFNAMFRDIIRKISSEGILLYIASGQCSIDMKLSASIK